MSEEKICTDCAIDPVATPGGLRCEQCARDHWIRLQRVGQRVEQPRQPKGKMVSAK